MLGEGVAEGQGAEGRGRRGRAGRGGEARWTEGGLGCRCLGMYVDWLEQLYSNTVSSFGICQGMYWQHLNQPCVAG